MTSWGYLNPHLTIVQKLCSLLHQGYEGTDGPVGQGAPDSTLGEGNVVLTFLSSSVSPVDLHGWHLEDLAPL